MANLIAVTEAAQIVGVSTSTIYRWIQAGVLSLLYFADGRQAIDREELDAIDRTGENAMLYQIFRDVERSLAKAVALLPAVESALSGPQRGARAWPDTEWERIRVMAAKQAESHLDVGPFIPRRGRPPKGRAHRFTGERFVNRFTGEPIL